MRRTQRRAGDIDRFDRWSFDEVAPAALKLREDQIPSTLREETSTAQARDARITPQTPEDWRTSEDGIGAQQENEFGPLPQDAPAQPQIFAAPIPPPAREAPIPSWVRETPIKPPAPLPRQQQPRPGNPAASPWRKIQIPDTERQRAAAAGLDRYLEQSVSNRDDARPAPLPVGARFVRPQGTMPPVAAPEPAATVRASQQRRVESAAPQSSGNPHLGLTVGVIVAVTVAAAIGLSWVAAPDIDAAPPQRAEILQRFAPQAAEQPPERPAPRAPDKAPPPAAMQPIEVAP